MTCTTLEVMEFIIATDHPSLAGHFPHNPIVPGVVILDHIAALLLAHPTHQAMRIRCLQKAKFTRILRPLEKVCVVFSAGKKNLCWCFDAQVAQQTVVTGLWQLEKRL